MSETGGIASAAAGTDLFMMVGSTVTFDPGSGNVQIFNGTITDDSITSITNSAIKLGEGTNINSGLVIFNDNNTYCETTLLSGGVFDISPTTSCTAIKTLSGSGAVALSARTLALTAAADTFSGVVSGTSALTVTGTEALTGANTYSGGTTTTSGSSLTVNSNAALGAATGTVS